MVDALLAYPNQADNKRYSLLDLPEHIDYLVLTHNHQDHVMIETLIQIRHRIGEVVIPAGQQGSLIDPSLYLCLKQLGFNQVRELNHLDAIEFPEGKIICTPFLGEHGDLDIQCKAAWRIEACGRSVMCVADSDNVDNTLYEHINHLFPDLDILFLGMECDGAPYTWIYGPVLSAKVSRQQSEARRLNGSDAQRGMKLVEQLNPQTVFVYAMGLEPWLKFITSIDYADDDLAILESNKLIEQCQAQDRTAERIQGCAEFELTSKKNTKDNHRRLPARRINNKNSNPESVVSADNNSNIPETSIQPTFATSQKADPLSDLLDELHSAKIRITVVDGQLKINAPKGTLTKDLTTRIKNHKNDILALLNSHANTSDVSSSDSLPEDAILNEAFTPLSNQNMISNSKDATDILLTGATGFIGSFLLSELIQQTSATIHCLVRADNKQHAIDRVVNSLANYDIWDESINERIKVYCGDLSKQHLGLNQQQWDHLCSRVDIVFHNGATVHHLTPYEQLKATNVSGTLEILKLCTTEKNKELHFLSTLSVLPPPALAGENQFSENTPLANSPIPEGGYNRSKWMAEHLVWQARERGLKASIYRPGPISGDSLNGHCNANDFLYRLMLGYLYSKQAPDGETMLDLLPVDYAAKAIIYLALHNDEQTGSCYHLIHPNPVSSNLLFESCLNNGIEMQRVSYQQWFMSLQKIASSDSEHPLFPLVALFASRKQTDQKALTPTETHLPYDTSFSQGLLKDAPFDLPDLNEALFSTYLKSLNEVKVSSTNMNRHTSDNSSSSQSVMTL
ncbi:MAG: thioester reductase domain-containing protein [Pseudomonadota bacterium]